MSRWIFGVALIGFAVVITWSFTRDGEIYSPSVPVVTGSPISESEPKAPDLPASRILQTARLDIVVHDGAGTRQAGRAAWVVSHKAPIGTPLIFGMPGIQFRDHDGQFGIDVDVTHWTWLCVQAGQGALRARHVLVPPFHGRRDLSIVLDGVTRALHVFVRSAGLSEPVAEMRVHATIRDVRNPTAEGVPKTATTDVAGYACIDGLASGSYVVRTESAEFGDGAPYVQSVVLPPADWAADQVVLLETHPQRVAVNLSVHCAAAVPRGQLPPKLFVRRRGEDGNGKIEPLPFVWKEGMQRLEFKLAPGDYELDVLPLGAALFDGGSPVLSAVEGGAEWVVRLRENSKQTAIRLEGIDRTQFPVRVVPCRDGDPNADHDGLLFLGSRVHWHEPSRTVRGPDGDWRLIVHGRTAAYRAVGLTRFDGGEHVVRVEPACHLNVEWVPEGELPRDVIVEVGSGDEYVFATFKDVATTGVGVRTPAQVSSLVVPRRGSIAVAARDATGRILWQRTVSTEQEILRLRVP